MHEKMSQNRSRKTVILTLIHEPRHTKRIEFLVKKVNSQLTCQQRHVLNDGQSYSPFGILCQFDNSWQQGLTQLLDPDDFANTVQIGDDVEPDFRTFVLQLVQEKREKVFDGAVRRRRKKD